MLVFKPFLGLLLALPLCCNVLAADMPQGSRYDPRIQHVDYNADDVVIVRLLPGIGTRIVFAPDENIIDVDCGFTQGWQFNDRLNMLYIKAISVKVGDALLSPQAGKWNTNLMVRTNRRMYDFDLRLISSRGSNGEAPQNKRVAYRVEFDYPDADSLARAKLANKAKLKQKFDEKPIPRNWSYSMQVGDGSEGIAPTMAYDDGRFTYLKFPNNRDIPAAFIVAPDKAESIVNSHMDNDVLVIHRVSREFVLRLGKAVIGVYNDKFDPDGVPPENGTTVPGARRLIVGGN